jgi:hypothetical protein
VERFNVNRLFTIFHWLAVLACLVIVLFDVYVITDNPQWIFGDDIYLTETTAAGKKLPLMIYPTIGRFTPLGLFEYNMFIPFGNNPAIYYAWSTLKLLLLVLFLALSLRALSRNLWPHFLLWMQI